MVKLPFVTRASAAFCNTIVLVEAHNMLPALTNKVELSTVAETPSATNPPPPSTSIILYMESCKVPVPRSTEPAPETRSSANWRRVVEPPESDTAPPATDTSAEFEIEMAPALLMTPPPITETVAAASAARVPNVKMLPGDTTVRLALAPMATVLESRMKTLPPLTHMAEELVMLSCAVLVVVTSPLMSVSVLEALSCAMLWPWSARLPPSIVMVERSRLKVLWSMPVTLPSASVALVAAERSTVLVPESAKLPFPPTTRFEWTKVASDAWSVAMLPDTSCNEAALADSCAPLWSQMALLPTGALMTTEALVSEACVRSVATRVPSEIVSKHCCVAVKAAVPARATEPP